MKITEEHRKKAFAEFENRGLYVVKDFLARGLYSQYPHYSILAREWLAQKQAAQEDSKREEELAIAKEANRKADLSNRLAVLAIIVSIVAIIIAWPK